MYQSELHMILRSTIENTLWTRSTKDEDNYRQVLCSSLYKYVSPNNVEIPSTRSGHGDIKVFGRKIELKYASNEKVVQLEAVLEDFDLLLDGKVEFVIVAVRLDTSEADNYLHRSIKLPMLPRAGASPTFGDHGTAPQVYKGISIFLAATYQHAPRAVTMRRGKGKNSTAYLSFEVASVISRSSLLQTCKGYVHVDVIGSKEDGMVAFLYKRVDDVHIVDAPGPAYDVSIPYDPALRIASARVVRLHFEPRKFADPNCPVSLKGEPIEQAIHCYGV